MILLSLLLSFSCLHWDKKMFKSARTVIILWLDHVRSAAKPRKENLLHQVFTLLLWPKFVRKPPMRVDLPRNCCRVLLVLSSLLFLCYPLMVILQNGRYFFFFNIHNFIPRFLKKQNCNIFILENPKFAIDADFQEFALLP